VLNSTEWSDSQSYTGLVRSFSIPQDDADYGYDCSNPSHRAGYRMDQRSFVYDDALAVLAFLGANRADAARTILTQLARLQSTDGSLPFSVDDYLGHVADDYTRSGALAWVGYAAVQYEFETGSGEFRPLAEGIARYLESLQVTRANEYSADDPRYGSVLGGQGQYDSGYNYIDAPVTFASTEHNIDAYFFFRDLGYLTSRDAATGDQYSRVAELIKQSLLTRFWDAADQRFYQGVSLGGPDRGLALDLSSWGALLLRLRLAENISSDLASMQRLQAVGPQGGFLQTTAGSRSQPYEFHVWPAFGGTAWAALVTGNSSMLWAPDGWPDQRSSAAAPEDNVGAGAGSVINYAIGTSAGSSAGQASSDSAGPARPGTTRQRSRVATARRKRRRTRSGHRHARRAGRSQARPKN
jgi:hypothetical protein